MDEKKECGNCGKANPLANKFCQFCGTMFAEEQPGVWDEFMKSLPERKSKILMKAEGLNRKLLLMEDKIVIRCKRDFLSTLAVGEKGEKEIPISNITSIQFKRAGLVNGYIQFTYPGCEEAKGGVFQSIQDENSVAFGAEHEGAFVKIKDAIEEKMASPKEDKKQPLTLDDLEKLATLKEKGIISEEEFNEKKKQILGL